MWSRKKYESRVTAFDASLKLKQQLRKQVKRIPHISSETCRHKFTDHCSQTCIHFLGSFPPQTWEKLALTRGKGFGEKHQDVGAITGQRPHSRC